MMISLDNGHTYLTAGEAIPEILNRNLWDVVANAMDDDVRESVHNDVAPCSEVEFLAAYLERAAEDLVVG